MNKCRRRVGRKRARNRVRVELALDACRQFEAGDKVFSPRVQRLLGEAVARVDGRPRDDHGAVRVAASWLLHAGDGPKRQILDGLWAAVSGWVR